jgi:hypothetical protein
MPQSKRGILSITGESSSLTFARIEEFSSLPSAKLTVDEFREIWFQNASDPPSFAKPRAAIEEGSPDVEAEAEAEEEEEEELLLPSAENAEDPGAQEVEAQSAFLEEMVADRALEEEINRHLDNDDFQQALAEMDGTSPPLFMSLMCKPCGRNISLKNK